MIRNATFTAVEEEVADELTVRFTRFSPQKQLCLSILNTGGAE